LIFPPLSIRIKAIMTFRLFLVSLFLSATLAVCKGQPVMFVDPRGVHPPLFDGWERPKLLLFFTGFLEGYIEPCGCAGIEHMKGGLGRRHTLLQHLEREKGWDILPIDAGNLNRGFGQQEELKFNFVIDEAFRLMRYRAVGIGSRELMFPTDVLILYSVDVPSNPKRYTSANVGIIEFTPDFVVPYRVLEKAGMRIGVVSVLGDSVIRNITNEDIVTASAAEKLRQVLPRLEAERCDRTVLIIHGTDNEINQLLGQFANRFDFVIPSNTPAEPPLQPRRIGNTMILEVGERGRHAIAIGLFDDPETPIRYERIPFDSRFENSPTILELMKMYQDQLRTTGLEGLGIRPIPYSRTETLGNFVGTQSCADCHDSVHHVWRQTRHANAWYSLQDISIPPRDFDPECIACHVVGWNTTEFLPYRGGFLSERETPRLINVGCEACHGPGENHVRAEMGTNITLQESIRRLRRLSVENDGARRLCLTCHDGTNSPLFDFETYWEKIRHKNEEW